MTLTTGPVNPVLYLRTSQLCGSDPLLATGNTRESRASTRCPSPYTPPLHTRRDRDLNAAPGLLALAMERVEYDENEPSQLRGLTFVVPGGRFNEMYGWDSYMESLGLIIDGRVDLVEATAKKFCFCIKHYGKIFNANRSYYIGKSQPPFLTDMALRVYEERQREGGGREALDFLREAMCAAYKEYHSVLMAQPRLDALTGLSRYRPEGLGVPPETEASHFTHVLRPYAKKYGMADQDFVEAYNKQQVSEPELNEVRSHGDVRGRQSGKVWDTRPILPAYQSPLVSAVNLTIFSSQYFLHDRAVRESAHDTSYRLEKVAANLATIDLNSLLYKYEIDFAQTIKVHFQDFLPTPADYCSTSRGMYPNQIESSAAWYRRAENTRKAVDKYLWAEDRGMYFDYDTVKQEQTSYETTTTFWAMWAGLATPQRAGHLVTKALPRFEAFGGPVSGTEKSGGPINLDRPSRQWDYPYGNAPLRL